MREIKISVIVPIHNAGIYLNKCLESLVTQTLKELEFILVLDCPTDGSDKVVEEFRKKDDRIRVIQNPTNLHIGNSRNKGLEIAKGKYVAFRDHDDYLNPKMYEILYEQAEANCCDLVCSPYVRVFNGKIEGLVHYPASSPESLPNIIMKIAIGPSSNNDVLNLLSGSGAVWNKLFKRSIIKKYDLHFIDTNKSTAEDLIFLMEYSFYCKRACIVSEFLYYHVMRIDSTGKTLSYTAPHKVIFYLKYTYNFLLNNHLLDNLDIQLRFRNRIKKEVVNTLIKEYRNNKSLYRVLDNISFFKKESLIVETFREYPSYVFFHSTAIKKILFKLLRLLFFI